MTTAKRTIDINKLLATPAYKACGASGANMGRPNIVGGWQSYQWQYRDTYDSETADLSDTKLHLQRVTFVDGCYDRGGAYWGSPSDLWCGFTGDEQTMVFVRASDRQQAIDSVWDIVNKYAPDIFSFIVGKPSTQIECRNLDDTNEDELIAIMDSGREPKDIRQYAANKLNAIRNRLAGNIDVAMAFENSCERIYKRLPISLQW